MTVDNKNSKKGLFFNNKKKNKENIFAINNTNSIEKNKRNINKLSLSPGFSNNNNNYQKTDAFFNYNEELSSKLILGRMVNKNKKTKRNLFTMFKFSYY